MTKPNIAITITITAVELHDLKIALHDARMEAREAIAHAAKARDLILNIDKVLVEISDRHHEAFMENFKH